MARNKKDNGAPDLRTPDPLQGGTEDDDLGYQGTGLDMEDEVKGEAREFGERRQGRDRRTDEGVSWIGEDRRSGLDRRTTATQMAQ